jgi:hypothetical protein
MDQTMVDAGIWQTGHRHLAVKRVENGYSVEANFVRPRQVVIAFVNTYFAKDAHELRVEIKPVP